MVRVLGLEMENNYGDSITQLADIDVDFDIEATKGNFSLGDDPLLSNGGSRSYQNARAGVMKPTGSNDFDVDLETIGHFLRAFLDQYKFTAGSSYNTHEFYGGENHELSSWRLRAVYDIFAKGIIGALCDGLKLEVSDEKMTASIDWIYKTEFSEMIDEDEFEKLVLDCIIPVVFYDVSVKLDNKEPDGVIKSFSFEGKNNHNVDSTIGLGSRHPQSRAMAQQRENTVSVTTTLTRDTIRSILDGEYGEVDAMSPSECKIHAIPLELNIALCEEPNKILQIIFPKNIIEVEYEWDGTDDIEATINMTPLGTGSVTLKDGSTVKTDIYCRLINTRPEIKAKTTTVPKRNISVTVTNGTDAIDGVTVTLTNSTDSSKTYTCTTGSAGGCKISNVPLGSYNVKAEKTGYDNYTTTLNINSRTSTLSIKMDESS